MKRARPYLAAVLALLGCKSTASLPSSQVKDFDTQANPSLSIAFDDQATFCPAATKFNISNAYWLTLADAYVYATKDNLTAVTDQLKSQWASLTPTFISSPDSSDPTVPQVQALWLETDTVAVLAFRGTPLDRFDPHDIISDLNVKQIAYPPGGLVHKGFSTALGSIWTQVNAKLATLAGTDKALFITGHSLGAAMATLTAANILMTDPLQPIRSNLKGLYTIGSPEVGNGEFGSRFMAAYNKGAAFPIVRIRNHNDIVTRSPGGSYQHIGQVYYLTDDGRLYTQDQNLGFSRYQMPSPIGQSILQSFSVTELSDVTEHVPTNYFKKIAAEYMAEKASVLAGGGDPCDDSAFDSTAQVEDLGVAPGINRLEDLRGLKNAQLAGLFQKGAPGPIPGVGTPGVTTDGTGLPLIVAGNVTVNDLAFNIWEGKRFTTDANGSTTLVNKLANNWVNDISANVTAVNPGDPAYVDPGDGKGYVLLDYGKSNRAAFRSVRDEIRLIAPGLYLGRANIELPKPLWGVVGRYRFVVWFALSFDPQATAAAAGPS